MNANPPARVGWPIARTLRLSLALLFLALAGFGACSSFADRWMPGDDDAGDAGK